LCFLSLLLFMEINHGEKAIIFMKNIFVCIVKYRGCLLEYIDVVVMFTTVLIHVKRNNVCFHRHGDKCSVDQVFQMRLRIDHTFIAHLCSNGLVLSF